jgi:hypothetical protein
MNKGPNSRSTPDSLRYIYRLSQLSTFYLSHYSEVLQSLHCAQPPHLTTCFRNGVYLIMYLAVAHFAHSSSRQCTTPPTTVATISRSLVSAESPDLETTPLQSSKTTLSQPIGMVRQTVASGLLRRRLGAIVFRTPFLLLITTRSPMLRLGYLPYSRVQSGE